MKIALLGYIIRGPLGGMVWHHFQYVLGLHLLGHDVLFIEDSEEYPACYNPLTFQLSKDPGYGLSFINAIFSRYKLDDKWAYYDFHTNQWFGKSSTQVFSFLNNADILLNISGVNPLRDWVINIPKKVLVDTDPVFTQIKHLTNPNARSLAAHHDVFLTFGENYGRDGCTIPMDGFLWKPTRQPVVTYLWKTGNSKSKGNWTTVMQWESYKSLVWKNQLFGMKSMSFQPFMDLPKTFSESFELALGNDSAPRGMLIQNDWMIKDSLLVTKTPSIYQDFISNSKGEWSIAKQGYVITQSGWFSERSAVYLASGKPVILQDTGYSKIIETNEGLFPFKQSADLESIFATINENFEFHCKRAREICYEFFDYEKVLTQLLRHV